MFTTTHLRFAAAVIAALAASGCGLDKKEAPDLFGPSEFELSVTLTADPDQIPRDGVSQATVTVRARRASGEAYAGPMKLTILPAEAGISDVEVLTNANGEAKFTITAPPYQTVAANNEIIVGVTPVGDDFGNAAERRIAIGLLGWSNSTFPTAAFTFAPDTQDAGEPFTFDASATTDEGTACLDTCDYTWDFADGTGDKGRIVTRKEFAQPGKYPVRLTVTDATGATGTTVKTVEVAVP